MTIYKSPLFEVYTLSPHFFEYSQTVIFTFRFYEKAIWKKLYEKTVFLIEFDADAFNSNENVSQYLHLFPLDMLLIELIDPAHQIGMKSFEICMCTKITSKTRKIY